MSMRKLKQELDDLKYELYDLHHIEPNPTMYVQKRDELEYKIVCLEDKIELEEKMKPLRIVMMVFAVVSVAVLLCAVIVKYNR